MAEQDRERSHASRARRARVLLAIGALVTAAGVGLSGSLSRNIGGALVAIGWLVLVGGIHTYGRAGGDDVALKRD